mgnify:CR=1 FL=1
MKLRRVLPLLVIPLLALSLAGPAAAGDGTPPSSLEALYRQSAETARVIASGIALAFGVGFLLNLSRAQLARGTGDHLGYARALQQGLGMVIVLALAANVEPIAAGFRAIASGIDADPASPTLLTGVWEALARFFTSSVLGAAGVYTTVSAVGSGMAAHLSSLTGSPAGVSRTIASGLILAGGGILTLTSVLLANSLITAVF